MPHVIVKLWSGRSDQQKKKLAEEVTKAVMATLNLGEESVSMINKSALHRGGSALFFAKFGFGGRSSTG